MSNLRYVVCRNDDGTEYGVVGTPEGRSLLNMTRTELYKAIHSRPGAYHTAMNGKSGSVITIVNGVMVANHLRTSPNAVKKDNLGELPTFGEFAGQAFYDGIK